MTNSPTYVELSKTSYSKFELFKLEPTLIDLLDFSWNGNKIKECTGIIKSRTSKMVIADQQLLENNGMLFMIIVLQKDSSGSNVVNPVIEINQEIDFGKCIIPRIVIAYDDESTDARDYVDIDTTLVPDIINGSVIIRKKP